MSGVLQTLLTMLLLLLTSTVLSAGELQPAPVDGKPLSEQQWTQYDWNASTGATGAARFEIVQSKDGAQFQIIAATPNDARFVRELSVEPDTVYRLACLARSENVGSAARGAGISVAEIQDGSPDIKGSGNDWQLQQFYGRTGPDQRKLSVTVGIGGYGSLNSGMVQFRDVTVAKVSSAPAGIRVASLQPPTVVTTPVPAGQSWSGGATNALVAPLSWQAWHIRAAYGP